MTEFTNKANTKRENATNAVCKALYEKNVTVFSLPGIAEETREKFFMLVYEALESYVED